MSFVKVLTDAFLASKKRWGNKPRLSPYRFFHHLHSRNIFAFRLQKLNYIIQILFKTRCVTVFYTITHFYSTASSYAYHSVMRTLSRWNAFTRKYNKNDNLLHQNRWLWKWQEWLLIFSKEILTEPGIFNLGTENLSNMTAILKHKTIWKRKQLLYITRHNYNQVNKKFDSFLKVNFLIKYSEKENKMPQVVYLPIMTVIKQILDDTLPKTLYFLPP